MTRARIIGALGASGGIGTSAFVAALGVRAAHAGLRALCLDARPLAGGLDVVLGVDHEPGLRWGDLRRARGGLDAPAVLGHLPRAGDLPVVSFDRGGPGEVAQEALVTVLSGLASARDLVAVDLPAPADPTLPALLGEVDDAVLVCGAHPPALAAAGVVLAGLDGAADRWWLAQRVARGHDDLPERVAQALELPLLTTVPDDDRVAADLRRGVAPGRRGRLAAAADAALDALLLQERRAA